MKQWEKIEPASFGTLGLVVAVAVAYVLFVNGVLFQPPVYAQLVAWSSMTGGWVSPTLVATFPGAMLFLALIRWTKAMRLDALGLRAADVIPGAAISLVLWFGVELTGWLLDSLIHDSTKMVESDGRGALPRIFGQLIGNCLLEEVLFRGFFLVQFYLRFRYRLGKAASLIAALAASQLLFAIWHFPNDVWVKRYGMQPLFVRQMRLAFMGLLLAGVYLSTNNLIAAVGVHAIANVPLPVLSNGSANRLLLIPGVLILIAIALVARRIWTPRQAARNQTNSRELLQ